jgi:hypothetical protein
LASGFEAVPGGRRTLRLLVLLACGLLGVNAWLWLV